MIDASSSAPASRLESSVFSSTTWTDFSSSSAPMVSAPTPRFFFISRRSASRGDRTNLRRRPVSERSVSSPRVAKSRQLAISMEPLSRRSGSNSSFRRMRAGKSASTSRSASTESKGRNPTPYSWLSHSKTSRSVASSPPSVEAPLSDRAWTNANASTAESCRSAII